jgi:uncharacterized protein (DUF302 family)
MNRLLMIMLLMLTSGLARAELPGVLHWSVEQDMQRVYTSVYNALEENRFFVVFEPNIGENLKGFAERWGEDYNRNKLSGIRSMVFCNGWYANQVSNLEPQLLALCPLHLSVYGDADTTHVSFVRPSHVGAGSQAMDLLRELETDVVKAIEQGLAQSNGQAEGNSK